jgi:acetyl-CoA carboxylase carboxyltransferase component
MPDPRTLLEELHRRQALAEQGGGPARIAQQHRKGKLTARERLDLLLDEARSSSWIGSSPTGRPISASPSRPFPVTAW